MPVTYKVHAQTVPGDFSDIIPGTYGGQCVAWIQRYLKLTPQKYPGFFNNADGIMPKDKTPQVGSAVLTKEGLYHVALIIDIQGNDLILAESNYKGTELLTKGRRLPMNSIKIRGYYNFDK